MHFLHTYNAASSIYCIAISLCILMNHIRRRAHLTVLVYQSDYIVCNNANIVVKQKYPFKFPLSVQDSKIFNVVSYIMKTSIKSSHFRSINFTNVTCLNPSQILLWVIQNKLLYFYSYNPVMWQNPFILVGLCERVEINKQPNNLYMWKTCRTCWSLFTVWVWSFTMKIIWLVLISLVQL